MAAVGAVAAEQVARQAVGPGAKRSPITASNQSDLATCDPGQVWDAKKHKCLERHGGMLPNKT